MDIKRLLRKEQPAPLWKRVVAYLIDALILSIVLSPLQPMAPSYTSFSSFIAAISSTSWFTLQFLLSLLLVLCISLAYWVLLEYRFHQTLGKYLLKLHVRSEGKTLTLAQCILRNVAKLSDLLLFLDVLSMLFSKRTQRYSETLARTEVVSHV